jgi:hypothetical protein
VSVQDSSTVCAKRIIGADWMCPMVLLGDEAQVQAHFCPFGDSANLDSRRCTICDECTIGSEISLDAPNGTSR